MYWSNITVVELSRQITYQSRDCEVSSMHLLSQPVDFSPGIEEDDSLGDGQCFIQITQGVQLPLLETATKNKLCQVMHCQLNKVNQTKPAVRPLIFKKQKMSS